MAKEYFGRCVRAEWFESLENFDVVVNGEVEQALCIVERNLGYKSLRANSIQKRDS